jgi:hypothetical protein
MRQRMRRHIYSRPGKGEQRRNVGTVINTRSTMAIMESRLERSAKSKLQRCM